MQPGRSTGDDEMASSLFERNFLLGIEAQARLENVRAHLPLAPQKGPNVRPYRFVKPFHARLREALAPVQNGRADVNIVPNCILVIKEYTLGGVGVPVRHGGGGLPECQPAAKPLAPVIRHLAPVR